MDAAEPLIVGWAAVENEGMKASGRGSGGESESEAGMSVA